MYLSWLGTKEAQVGVSAGTMPRNKPHSCFRIALSRQLSREERSPGLNNSMWPKEGWEAINVAVPAGFLKWMWRGSHKSQLEQLLVSKLRQRERSMTVPDSSDTCLAGHWRWAVTRRSWMSILWMTAVLMQSPWDGERKWYVPGCPVPCPSLLCSLCWQCQFSNSPLSSLYMESLAGDDFLSSFYS